MRDIKVERREEIVISEAEIKSAAQDFFMECKYNFDSINKRDYIIEGILLGASEVTLDEDDLEIWRENMKKEDINAIMEVFWNEYERLAVEGVRQEVEERRNWDHLD